MADKPTLPTVPLLTGENYFNWKVKMESVLQLKRLVRILNTDRPVGDEKRKEKDEWDEKNADAVACIRLSLSDSQVLQFASETNAKQLWKAIHDRYAGPAEDRAIDAGEELKNIKMLDSETASEYISRARGLAVKCTSAGLIITERQIAYNTVRGLHNKFSQIREILKTQRDKKLEEILEILKEKERELQKGSSGEGQDTAYATKNFHKKKFHKKCFICGKTNHVAKDCYHRKNREAETSGQQGRSRRDNNKNKTVSLATENKVDYASFQAFNGNYYNRDRNKWIIDSGCTSHMSFEKEYFINFKPLNGKVYLAGKNDVLESKGIGSLKVKIQSSEQSITYVTIHDVIYVPELRSNLLSVAKLMERGLKVNFAEFEVRICKNTGEVIALGEQIDNHFIICMNPTIDNECNSTSVEEINSKFSDGIANMWHRRLGHINDKYEQRLTKENLVNGIDNKIGNIHCEACKICKLPRKPHKDVVYSQSKDILDLIHVDICGPMPVSSIGGSRYVLLVIDDFSNMYFTYFLKNKSETLSFIQKFNEKCKNVLTKGIKCMRTDNGTEFINNKFHEFTDKEGIVHQRTVPYNPESNGKVERGNRVILERARTLLFESQLPLTFWAEAVACVTHTTNLTPKRNMAKTPYEVWNGKIPNVSYLRTFGCVAYYHIPKNLRNKLQPSGKRAIMLGYSRERVAYRLFDIKNKTIIEERNVKFDEMIKGSDYLKESKANRKYEDWDIGNLLDTPNDVNNDTDIEIESVNDIDEQDDSEIESIVEDNDIRDRPMDIDNLDVNEDAVQIGAVRRGRPPGLTAAESLRRKEEGLREREERLREEGVRRSERLSKLDNAHLVGNIHVPHSYEEARNNENWKQWKIAMESELASLDKHNVWDICERPTGAKIVKSKWVFSIKESEDKGIKYKARLVAAGFNQVKNRDYDESYSPVISIDAWRTLIAIAAKKKLNVRFFDVKTAYLYGKLDETVYLEPPPGFGNKYQKGKICKLKKSLYGLPQSGRNWYYKLKEELSKNGLKPLASESCIFSNSNETYFFVFGAYVDDFITIADDSKMCENIINSLQKEFEVTETTQTKQFLGMRVECDDTGIYISQCKYIEKLLDKYGMSECKPVGTPMVTGEDKMNDEESESYDAKEYQELIGELLYLANRTRPDIAFVTSYLSQYNHRPEKRHYKLGKRVLRYLSGTKHKRLGYDRKLGLLEAYSDSSWGNAIDGRSFSGGAIFIGNSLVSWKCKKQRNVGNSTCEVELCAVSEIVKDIMWIQNMLTELHCNEYVNTPTQIYCDNQATIQWLKNARSSTKTRHVNLKFHFVREKVENNTIAVSYVSTNDMIADCFTKCVTKDKLEWSCNQMCLN